MNLYSVTSAATIESLVKELAKGEPLIQLWDEMDTWSQTMGLYKSGGGNAYDRSLFCTLYSSPKFIRRQLKGTDGMYM